MAHTHTHTSTTITIRRHKQWWTNAVKCEVGWEWKESKWNHCINSFRIDVTVWLGNITKFKHGKWLRKDFHKRKKYARIDSLTSRTHRPNDDKTKDTHGPLLWIYAKQPSLQKKKYTLQRDEHEHLSLEMNRMQSHNRLNAVVRQLNVFTSLKWNVWMPTIAISTDRLQSPFISNTL